MYVMAVILDISGLEDFVETLENAKNAIPELNKEFLQQEWHRFLSFALSQPNFPYDTGQLANSFLMSEVRQDDALTEADWSNIAEYASSAEYGGKHYITGQKIMPNRFWEKAFRRLESEQGKRYAEMFEKLFNGGE